MKKIVREYEFSPEELKRVRELSARLGITETTAGILYARGQDTEEKMLRFLHPSKENFLSPFLMQGMKEAVGLLAQAREEEWRVAIFGDYDADGIGACAILSRALKMYGIEPYLYIPEREDGYGMSVKAIDAIFDEFLPDLIVTVDCGVSNADEVEYIKSMGAYVIVTDHHELPEQLPDCICINPKLKDDYPYDNLCGAGVAYKLAAALIGERANELLDLCALSTVADSVPLLGENRDIVSEGLKLLEKRPRPAITALLGKQTEVTAQTLAFTLAPRVNAAGRMGDAQAALRLFTTEDEGEIIALAEKLSAYNLERQTLCDELYEKARTRIAEEGAYGNVVMLVGEDWHAGLIGIVAARLAEEFCRPALLFVKKGDMLRGSARSIESVNIYEALKACSEVIEQFGGHSQAAGVNVKEENYLRLKLALDDYIGAHYTREDFEPTLTVCEEISGAFPWKLARELEKLEPYGVGNKRPLFLARAGKLNAAPLKPLSPHVVAIGEMDYVYFGGAKELKLLKSEVKKQLIFECNLSRFRGRESLKGFIRAVSCEDGGEASLDAFETFIRSLPYGLGGRKIESKTEREIDELIARLDGESAYGLCVVAGERDFLERYPSSGRLPREVYRLSSGNVRNVLLLSPVPDCDLSAYRDVVFLETPVSIPFRTGRARLYADGGRSAVSKLHSLDLSRGAMVEVFSALRGEEGKSVGESYAEIAQRAAFSGFSVEMTVFALAVFEELELFEFRDGKLRLMRGKKTELTNSQIYREALKLTQVE